MKPRVNIERVLLMQVRLLSIFNWHLGMYMLYMEQIIIFYYQVCGN